MLPNCSWRPAITPMMPRIGAWPVDHRFTALHATPTASPHPAKPRKLTVPWARAGDSKTALTLVDGPWRRSPVTYPNERKEVIDGAHGPGMHCTCGAMSRLRFEKVWEPEQPLKACPTVMAVTASAGEIVKSMGRPWAVVPLH